MQNTHSQSSLSQRSGGVRPPPISKYYYGPAQSSWSASDKSPTPERSPGWGANSVTEPPPSLPPRLSPAPVTNLFSQPRTHSSSSSNSPQSWQLPGPPPLPPVRQMAPASYNPNTYGPMPGARQSPVTAPWNQYLASPPSNQRNSSSSTSDTSKWTDSAGGRSDNSERFAKYTNSYPLSSGQATKPPLPPRTQDPRSETKNYNRYETPSTSQHLTSWATQESPVQELLQPIAYNPIFPQVVTDSYPVSPPNGDTSSQIISEPQRSPPPKPPKLPQAYPDELQRNIEDTPRNLLLSTQSTAHHYEPIVNQALRQPQDLSEHSQPQRAQSIIGPTVEPTEIPERQVDGFTYMNPEPAVNNETGKTEITPRNKEKLLSPTASHGVENEDNDDDDIHWMLPLIEEIPESKKVLSPPLENPALRYQHQGRVDDALHSFPSSAASSTQRAPSADASIDQAILQSHEISTKQQDTPATISNQNEHGHKSSLHGHSSRSLSSLQEKENGSFLSGSEPSNIAINPHEPQRSASPGYHQSNTESGNKPSLAQPTAKTYNASALGFGGPSDWEHFGDHQAEEVDDTDLYRRNRSHTITKATEDSAEVSTETLPFSSLQRQNSCPSKEDELAPSSETTSPQSSSRPPSDFPFQSTIAHTNSSTRETVNPIFSSQFKASLAVQNDEIETSTDSAGIVPGRVETDLGESRPDLPKDPALKIDQVLPMPDAKAVSIENSRLEFSSDTQSTIISREFSAPVPPNQSTRSDDSSYQWQSAEGRLVTNLIKTRILTELDTSVSAVQDTGNNSESTDAKANIGETKLLPASDCPTQRHQAADSSQMFNTTARLENPQASSTSKSDVSEAQGIGHEPGSTGDGITTDTVKLSPRVNDSLHQQRRAGNSVNPNQEPELYKNRTSSLTPKERSLQDQTKDEFSKPNNPIHLQNSVDDLIIRQPDMSLCSDSISSASSTEIDKKTISDDSIHQQHSTESPVTTNYDIKAVSARLFTASTAVEEFQPRDSGEKPKSSDGMLSQNCIPVEPKFDPIGVSDSSWISLSPKENTSHIECTVPGPELTGFIRQQDLIDESKPSPEVGLNTEADHLEFKDFTSPMEDEEDITKNHDVPLVIKISEKGSTLAQPKATKSSILVDTVTGSNTQAIDKHLKERPEQVPRQQVSIPAPSITIATDNPYADLDPWGKASLNRYFNMLNEEARAKTDQEKLNVFMVFADRETRLRAVLYGSDDGKATTRPVLESHPSKHLAETLTKRSEKALPALPPIGELKHSSILDGSLEKSSTLQVTQSVTKPKSSILVEKSRPDLPSGLNTSFPPESPSDDMQYSPGGRPVVVRAQGNWDAVKNPATELTLREKVSKVFTHVAGLTNSIQSPGSDVPIVVSSEASIGPEKSAYVPSKYKEHGEPTEYANNHHSACRPFAALKESIDSGSTIAIDFQANKEGIIDTFATTTFSEPIQKSGFEGNEKGTSAESRSDEKSPKDLPLDLRRFVRADFDPLISVLPSSGKMPQDSVQLQDMKNAIDAVPDDFSFIHQSVVNWDTEAKKEREIHERDRHVRQGESERKIDALFNDHEIGYGDISELESEFKSSEAATKADEDRAEYQTFLSSVFDVVWTRLHFEIAQLTPLHDQYSRIMNDTLVGKDMFEGSASQFALAPTMKTLLALHQKLEIRHQKAFEAVLERDRRLKKTEVSPWYTLGNVAKVKQLEKQFDSAEKKAAVDYYKQRNSRANKLMDVLDHNTLRGVGANQDYMQAIMKSIRRIASGRAFASIPSSEPGLGVEEVMKAKSITMILAGSSEQIVQTFHVADMLLNASDYDVSIANAKLANSDANVFARLKEERSKEDQKLMGSLEHRLALIREDSRKTNDEIVKLMLFLGVQNGHAQSLQKGTSSPPIDAVRADLLPNTSGEIKWRQQ
ncbi:hypothetical protein MMC07_003292 [Pseudocyphellaria aurata]|nr:hypothetical protein [Pseudocyphellaria aurata]